MRRIFMGAMLAAMLMTPAAIQARGHGSHGSHGHSGSSGHRISSTSGQRIHNVSGPSHTVSSVKTYHLTYGKKFSQGWFYKGKSHKHWSYRSWWSKYNCYRYYCPSTCCWYYYCQPQDCYYPVSYVNSAPPINDGGTEVVEGGSMGGEVPPPPSPGATVQPIGE